jgi:hypothetical protein
MMQHQAMVFGAIESAKRKQWVELAELFEA